MLLSKGDGKGRVKVQEVEDPVERESTEKEEDGEQKKGGGASGRGPDEEVMYCVGVGDELMQADCYHQS